MKDKVICDGKYRLVEKIGKGVFGVVAKAISKEGKEVALKALRVN